MSMQTKLMIAGILFVALLMIFKPRHYDEAKRKYEQSLKGKDELAISLEEFTSKEKKEKEGFLGGGDNKSLGSTFGLGKSTSEQAPAPAPAENSESKSVDGWGKKSDSLGIASRGKTPNPYASPYAQNPAPAAPSAFPSPAGQPKAAESDSYYPPLVEADGRPKQGSAPKPVFFEAEKAFTFDDAGNKIPMPDGVYMIGESGSTVIIQGGRKIAPNN